MKQKVITWLLNNGWARRDLGYHNVDSFANSLAFDVDIAMNEIVLINDNGDFAATAIDEHTIDWLSGFLQCERKT